MKNLVKETIECLHRNGKSESDVLWVGRNYHDYAKNEDICYKNTWENFCTKANFMYDDGYGCAHIPKDLIVVGKDFWLERHDYDGAEWWEFKTLPVEPEEVRELEVESTGYWYE